MSSHLARNALRRAPRASASSLSSARVQLGRRPMSASSTVGDAAHAVTKSNDRLWIIGSALFFGPAFLYLVSPTARKNRHDVHNDKHDFPGFTPQEHGHAAAPAATPAPEIMKDDEGTEADVASSVVKAEQEDVPNDAGAVPSESVDAAEKPAGESTDKFYSGEQKHAREGDKTDTGRDQSEKSGTFLESDEKGPTEMGKARDAAQHDVMPKQASEGKTKDSE